MSKSAGADAGPHRWGRRQSVRAAGCLIIALIVPGLAACGSSNSSSPGGGGSTGSGSSTAPIIIGSDLELSGAAGSYGTPEAQGAQFYIDQVNATGGVGGRKVQLDSENNQSTTTQAVTDYQKFVGDSSVVATFGPALPATATLMAQLAQQNKLPLLSFLSSTSDSSFNANSFWFRFAYSAPLTVKAEANVIKGMGVKSIGVLYADDTGGHAGLPAVQAAAKAAGISISSSVSYPDGVTDPTVQVLRAKSSSDGAYFVYDPDSVARLGQVVRTMRSNGITAPIFVPENAALPDFATAAGSTITGVYFWGWYTPENPTTATQKQFVSAWKTKYNALPTDFQASGYSQAQVLVGAMQSLQKAGKAITRSNMRAAIEGLSGFDSVFGKVTYSPTNHAEPFPAVNIFEYKNGSSFQASS